MNKHISKLILLSIIVFIFGFPVKIIKADPNMIKTIAENNNNSTFHMRITAYSSTPDQTDSTPFITANGDTVHDGVIASNIFPFGTRLQIPSFFGKKIFTVEDRMSSRIKNTLDIWMPDRQDAIDFGIKSAEIIVLNDSSKTLAVK
jgi:3D (Asp-Asp-Asp) domain-containing protein